MKQSVSHCSVRSFSVTSKNDGKDVIEMRKERRKNEVRSVQGTHLRSGATLAAEWICNQSDDQPAPSSFSMPLKARDMERSNCGKVGCTRDRKEVAAMSICFDDHVTEEAKHAATTASPSLVINSNEQVPKATTFESFRYAMLLTPRSSGFIRTTESLMHCLRCAIVGFRRDSHLLAY